MSVDLFDEYIMERNRGNEVIALEDGGMVVQLDNGLFRIYMISVGNDVVVLDDVSDVSWVEEAFASVIEVDDEAVL